LSEKHNKVLKKIAQDERHKILTTLPKVVERDTKEYLVLVGNYAWASTGKLVDTHEYRNLHFLKVKETQAEVESHFTVFGAELFLGFVVSKDTKPVLYLSSSQINEMRWEEEVNYEEELTEEALKGRPTSQWSQR
jgi:hypothetical protein